MADPAFAEAVAKACEWREEWFEDQIQIVLEGTEWRSERQMERAIGPLKRQLVRLRNRPTKPLLREPARVRREP